MKVGLREHKETMIIKVLNEIWGQLPKKFVDNL